MENLDNTNNNLHVVDKSILSELAKNENRSFSGLFKSYRMKVPLIGDMVVLKWIAYLCGTANKPLDRDKVRQASLYSIEYNEWPQNEKRYWIDEIVKSNQEGLQQYEKNNRS